MKKGASNNYKYFFQTYKTLYSFSLKNTICVWRNLFYSVDWLFLSASYSFEKRRRIDTEERKKTAFGLELLVLMLFSFFFLLFFREFYIWESEQNTRYFDGKAKGKHWRTERRKEKNIHNIDSSHWKQIVLVLEKFTKRCR